MDFNEYQKQAAIKGGFGVAPWQRKLDNKEMYSRTSVLLGLSSEAGEIQDIFKKNLEREIPIDREELIKEMGDLLWYLSTLAYDNDIPLEVIARVNLWKLDDKNGR